MKSLQKPKKIIIHGTDGKEYGFLVKTNDDLRKDARTMEFNYMINSLLKKNPESRDNELCKLGAPDILSVITFRVNLSISFTFK